MKLSDDKSNTKQVCAIKKFLVNSSDSLNTRYRLIDATTTNGCYPAVDSSLADKAVFLRYNQSTFARNNCSVKRILSNLQFSNAVMAIFGYDGPISTVVLNHF